MPEDTNASKHYEREACVMMYYRCMYEHFFLIIVSIKSKSIQSYIVYTHSFLSLKFTHPMGLRVYCFMRACQFAFRIFLQCTQATLWQTIFSAPDVGVMGPLVLDVPG